MPHGWGFELVYLLGFLVHDVTRWLALDISNYVPGAEAGSVPSELITSAGENVYQEAYIIAHEFLRSTMKIVTSSQKLLARRKKRSIASWRHHASLLCHQMYVYRRSRSTDLPPRIPSTPPSRPRSHTWHSLPCVTFIVVAHS